MSTLVWLGLLLLASTVMHLMRPGRALSHLSDYSKGYWTALMFLVGIFALLSLVGIIFPVAQRCYEVITRG